MIGVGKASRVFAWTKPIDMRKSFRALASVVTTELQSDPMTGAVFLFIARNKKRAKVIWFDGTGFCLFQKQVSKGCFAAPWDHAHDGVVTLSASQLAAFIEGSPLAFIGALSFEEVVPQKMTTQIAPIR